jgi:hypothetical protein
MGGLVPYFQDVRLGFFAISMIEYSFRSKNKKIKKIDNRSFDIHCWSYSNQILGGVIHKGSISKATYLG